MRFFYSCTGHLTRTSITNQWISVLPRPVIRRCMFHWPICKLTLVHSIVESLDRPIITLKRNRLAIFTLVLLKLINDLLQRHWASLANNWLFSAFWLQRGIFIGLWFVIFAVKHACLLDVDCFRVAIELHIIQIYLWGLLFFIVSILLFNIAHQWVLSLNKLGLSTKHFVVPLSLNNCPCIKILFWWDIWFLNSYYRSKLCW